MVKILDCTIRDGGHDTNWVFDHNFVIDLMKKSNENNVHFFEIGYRNHLEKEDKGEFFNCTPELIKEFLPHKGNLKLGVMTDTSRFSLEDFPNVNDDNIDFVRIACHSDRIQDTLEIAEELHKRGYRIFIQLMDITSVDANGYLQLFAWENKSILESLYFADSYGKLTPLDTTMYYNKLMILGYNNISFHGHDKSKLALKNSLQVITLGGYSIDISEIKGERFGGNLTSEEFFKNYSTNSL